MMYIVLLYLLIGLLIGEFLRKYEALFWYEYLATVLAYPLLFTAAFISILFDNWRNKR